ncbi:MAG: hypothetical protein ACI9YT_002849 [Halobacteriales archaeon]|jgi:uncharacterized protein YeaO (DUF488 family)
MSGQVYDTYVAALQHDTADVPEDAIRVGVVRRPPPWFRAQVDENVPELGPPADLLEEFKDRYEALQEQGLGDAEAHDAALEDVDYDDRYRSYLGRSDGARAAIEALRDRLESGDDVVLVCYENTDEKRCHRTLFGTELE